MRQIADSAASCSAWAPTQPSSRMLGRDHEAVQTRLVSNPIEFDGIKTRVIDCDKARGAYNRAQLTAERRQMTQAWVD